MCKQKVVPSDGDSDSESDSGDSGGEENEVSENTPLLRSLASTSAHSFGTMSGSLSQHEVESSDYDEHSDTTDSEEEVTVETVVVQLQQGRPDNMEANA